jgi:hypothetical protein
MLLTQESGLLARLLSDDYPDSVHERLMLSLKAMMMAEEVRSSKLVCLYVLHHRCMCTYMFVCMYIMTVWMYAVTRRITCSSVRACVRARVRS